MIDFTFIAERYNYWIFIVLMMIGLYTVIARGNLMKKIVGLNIFQTSVFIYYISIGKISGGTAPILLPGDDKAHGGGHGEAESHAGDGDHATGDSLHAEPGAAHGGLETNDLADAVASAPAAETGAHESLHAGAGANPPIVEPAPDAHGPAFETAPDAVHGAVDALHKAGETIYTNPLPHVLILTAIVVGVATTAVGLALAVRIREAYGTIEEDELEAADEIAEFGHQVSTGGAGA